MNKISSTWFAALSVLMLTFPAAAEPVPPPGVPAMPTYKLVPRTATSIPLGTAILPGAHEFLHLRDLAKIGYVEEEYFLSGTANVYSPDGAEVTEANLPYVTRMLLIRPADPKKWSGDIQLSALRNLTEASEAWLSAADYIMEHGDILVGLTVSSDNIQYQHMVFDPLRYAPLMIPDDGFRRDLMMQAGWLLRSPEGLLAKSGFSHPDIKIISSGWSMNGALQVALINGGHHARARTPQGGPIIDGYISGINNAVIQKLPLDAAVIRLNSEAETSRGKPALKIREPDSDAPNARFRLYEVVAVHHGGYDGNPGSWVPQFQVHGNKPWPALAHCKPLPVDTRSSYSPFGVAVYENMSRWLHKNIAPPPAAAHWTKMDAEGNIQRDADGYALGGLRPYFATVPTSRIELYPEFGSMAQLCDGYASEERFSPERLKKLYPNQDTYVAKVSTYLDSLVRARYIRAAEAAMDLERAKQDQIH